MATKDATSKGTAQGKGAKVRIAPPLVFLFCAVLGFFLPRLLGFDVAIPLSRTQGLVIAGLLALFGAGLILWAGGLFQRTGQDPRPWLESPELIISGIYRYTRNPMYVAMALIQTAIGIGLCNGLILALVPVALTIVFLGAVRPEEAYLREKFGDAYRDYTRSVRRWL